MIASGKVVTLHYILRNGEGDIIDQSQSDDPLSYLHGASNIVPGLEIALEGRGIGDEFSVAVEPADGYGDKDQEMLVEIPRSEFGPEEELEVGLEFEVEIDGHPEMATIVEILDDSVIADFNHPLAGEILYFSVSVVDIRDATDSEIEHGHVHGDHDHHH